MEKVRVAVLGAGLFASQAHLPGIQAHSQAELVALYSRNREQAERVAAKVGGVPEVTTDMEALLARHDLDAVTVASSDDNHYWYTMAALRAGKHVFCEKPLAVNAQLAAEMVREAQARKRINQVGFIFRYTYCLQELRRLVKAGEIGKPYFVRVEWQGFSAVRSQRALTWRNRAESYGAGFIAELGSHFVDGVNWIVAPVSEVCAIAHALPRDVTDEGGVAYPNESLDMATLLLRTTDQQQGQITVSRITPAQGAAEFFQVVGEDGALWASLTRGQGELLRRIRPGGHWEDVELPMEAKDGQPHAIGRMLSSFIDACLRGGIDPDQDADFLEGYRVQSALDQAVVSTTTRRFESVAQNV
jgi:predicted dehydrogenase